MERKGRHKDILDMALKKSGIQNQKKCRKSLLSEFVKCAITSSEPDAASAIPTSAAPDAASAIPTSAAPDAVSAILTSAAPDAASAILTSSAPDTVSAIFASSAPDAASTILTSAAPDAASAILTSAAPDAASAILTSSAPDTASAIFASSAPDAASAILTSAAPDAASAILTSSAPDTASAILASSAPDAASAILTSAAPDAASAILTSSAPDTASAIFASSAPDAASAILTSAAPDAASAILTSSAPDTASAILASSAPDAASAILTSAAPDAASAILTSSAPDTASAIFASSAPDAASAILTSAAPDAASAILTSSAPDTGSAILASSAPDAASAIFASSTPDAASAVLTSSTPDDASIPNSESIVVASYVSQQPLEILPGTSETKANHSQSSILRITRPGRKDYLDYMSDDELALLNAFGDAGSSDEWQPEGNPSKKRKRLTLDVDDEIVGNKAPKKLRKNKRKETAQKRLSGQTYTKNNGEIVQEKKVQPNPCAFKKCGNNCGDITEERRLSIFNHFWSLSEQRRKDWVISLTQKTAIKRKRSKDSEKRTTTYKYNITDGEAHRQVCLQFLCKTIDVSHKYIYYTVTTADEFGSAKESERGKGVPPNKTSNDEFTAVENYIKCLPAVPSHYCRKDSTRTYLPAEYKNLANLYRKYKEHRSFQGLTFVSESIFRKIFNENFNIAFHIPKKDKCLKCCMYENKTDLTPEQQQAYEAHLIEKDHTYNRYKMHKSIHTKDSGSICISFDLQKVLNTPYGDSMLLFYTRKLAVYNAVIYENGTRNVYCYYWDESKGNRGANEMASILSKYITMLDERGNIKRLLLYCDCCPGQNRNKIVLAMLHDILQRCKTIASIQMNFLLTGHTYMTVDSAHATIENQVKNTTIWAPSQWYTVFQTARQNPRPFDVAQLTHKDFKRWDLLADKYFVGNLVGKISKIRIATFKKNRTSVAVKFSMDPETPVSHIEVASKTKILDLPDCYPTPLPINEKKHKDLLKLCSDQVIPEQFQAEYLALTCNKKVKDTLPDTDVEDNVDQ